MQKVVVNGINKNSDLLKSEPHWAGPKSDFYIDQESIDETAQQLGRLTFPCVMQDTGQKDLYGKRILVDEHGAEWSEGHFDILKTKDLTGPLLDCWVAFAKGWSEDEIEIFGGQCVIQEDGSPVEFSFEPSSNWGDGGPILESGLISVFWEPKDSKNDPGHWRAFIRSYDDDGFIGDTPLIAAMRAYVASKHGDEVPPTPVFRVTTYRGPTLNPPATN